MKSASTAIELNSVSKSYGGSPILDDISVAIAPGEFVVILGESGCGKSTLLKIIAGLEQPTAGTVRIGDEVMTDVAPKDRRLAMVFQSCALYPHLKVWENISFPIKMSLWKYAYSLPLLGRLFPKRRRILRTMREAAERAAGKVRLTPLLDRKPRALSGGQRQRVALARAIVDGREICLMDEPLSNLDAQLRASTRREIADLHRDLGHTIVYVTHDQTEAMTMGTRVILMREGRIEQDGAPAELYEQPATTYAAEFLGSPRINFLRVASERFSQAAARDVVTLGDGRCPLDPRGDLLIGVRPDHLEITPDANGEFAFLSSEYLGGKTIVSLRREAGEMMVQAFGPDRLDRTQRYSVRFEGKHAMCFDPQSGRRIRE